MRKVIFETEQKNHEGKPFLTVKQTDGYTYCERVGQDSIAFILYNRDTEEFGLIHEKKPPLGDDVYLTTAFGGSLDSDKSPLGICIQEVAEEAGYVVDETQVYALGRLFVSTQMNQYCHLFLVDITNAITCERELSDSEVGSEVIWCNIHSPQLLEDWKTLSIIIKAMDKDII